MPVRTILVPSWPGCDSDRPIDAALALARRVGAHVDALFVSPDPHLLAASLPGAAVLGGLAAAIAQGNRDALREARARFDAWRRRHDLAAGPENGMLRSTFARWSERTGLPEQVVVRRGRLSDVIVLDFPEPRALPGRVLDAALFETGRPVLLAPARLPDDLLHHVVVAWNGSLEATRALASALPILHEADAVTVLTTPGLTDRAFDTDPYPDDLDLVDALEWQGIRARRCEVPAGAEGGAGAALLAAAGERRASLLVMGGFTHGRNAGAVLGSMTRHVLSRPVLPVLMAH